MTGSYSIILKRIVAAASSLHYIFCLTKITNFNLKVNERSLKDKLTKL